MFAPEYKKSIPRFVKTVGIVTASTGAAVRDIINISTRRNPYVQLILYPAIVQGEAAAASIVKGIQELERRAVDVIAAITNSGLKYSEKEVKVDMCQAIKEMREEARLIGRNEGREEGLEETARRMLKLGKYTLEEIAICSDLSIERINELQNER